jgi:thiamine biosynthesis lipoprotein
MTARKSLMGTEFEITVVHSSIDSGKKAMYFALREIERIEKVTSNYKDTTEISYVNRNAGEVPVNVSKELFELIKRSKKYSEELNGFFDISVGPLTDYWGFNSSHPIETEPDKKIINSLLSFVSYKYIFLDTINQTISYLKKGVNIDLGGIAKGYALDKACEVLRERGITNFLINGGGDLYASGLKADGTKWKVGIKNPRDETKLLAVLELTNMCIATSGDYERYKIINGIRYHHILNPFNGFPAPISQSSSVIASTCEEGVVLSKYFFILGYNEINSSDYSKNYPYFIVDSEGKTHYNKLIEDYNLKMEK